MAAGRFGVLYISYDGLLEPLGQSQILAYLEQLSGRCGASSGIVILTFDKPSDMNDRVRVRAVNDRLEKNGIKWISLRYHSYPKAISTAYDVIAGFLAAYKEIKEQKIEVVHARSYVPALIALMLKKSLGKKFMFDMRGFWADERVEGGIWKKGLLYAAAKFFEKRFLLNADVIITLTHNAKADLLNSGRMKSGGAEVFVIPTCVDLERFAHTNDDSREFAFVYSGSLSTWYEPDAICNLFIEAKKHIRDARMLILTKEERLATAKIEERGLTLEDVTVKSADYAEMPRYLARCKIGIAFYRPGYSRKGCSPVKVGEYLACGLPVLATAGVGDLDNILEGERIGVVVPAMDAAAYSAAINKIIGLLKEWNIGDRCRGAAKKYYSLDTGVQEYKKIYEGLLKS